MSFSQIINYLLYALSGFCFGIFASRYSVLAAKRCLSQLRHTGLPALGRCLPQLLWLICSFFIFPLWFSSKTTTGVFVYYACLLLFFSKGLRIR